MHASNIRNINFLCFSEYKYSPSNTELTVIQAYLPAARLDFVFLFLIYSLCFSAFFLSVSLCHNFPILLLLPTITGETDLQMGNLDPDGVVLIRTDRLRAAAQYLRMEADTVGGNPTAYDALRAALAQKAPLRRSISIKVCMSGHTHTLTHTH